MPEELKILVVDEGRASGNGHAPSAPGNFRPPSVPAVGPPVQPPGFVQPPPVQPPSIVQAQAVSAPSGARAPAAATTGLSRLGAAMATTAAVVTASAAAITAGFATASVAVRKFAQTIQANVAELSGVSIEVATAAAQTELRRFFATVRRGQRIGPELAAAETLRSKFETATTDLQTEMLGVLLKILEEMRPAIVAATKITELVTDYVANNSGRIKDLFMTLLKANFPFLHLLLPLLERIAGNTEEKPPEIDPFGQEFMNMLPPNPWIWPADQPIPGRPQVEPGV